MEQNLELAPYITYISREIALCGVQTCNMSLVLILLSTMVQLKDLTLERALDSQICLSRLKEVLFKLGIEEYDSPGNTVEGSRDQETKIFYLD